MTKSKIAAVILFAVSSSSFAAGNCGVGVGQGNATCDRGGNPVVPVTSVTPTMPSVTVTTPLTLTNTVGNVTGGSSTIGNLTTGPSTATVGNVTTGSSDSSVRIGNLTTGASNASVGNLTTGSSTSAATGGQGGQGGVGVGGQGGSVTGNIVQSTSDINFNNNVPRAPVSSAVAPTTVFSGGLDSCMGSTTGSVQGFSVGVAIGSTWTDNHCTALRAAVRLNELGYKKTAAARLCAIPEIAQAFRLTGEFECNPDKE